MAEITTRSLAPGFEPVAEAFARNFTEEGDPGAAFAACHNGALVVDLYGGDCDAGRPWAPETLMPVFSGTKGLVAACALILIERGQLDPDAFVARYWPEFAAEGKERIRVRHVLSHRTGLPGIAAPLTSADLTDDLAMENHLAAQAQFRDPDAFASYHGLTIGWLVGGLIRRIDGRSAGRFFAEEIAEPLGLNAHIGLPEALEPRVGKVRIGAGMKPFGEGFTEDQKADPVLHAIWGNPKVFEGDDFHWNSRAYHAAEIPGANGLADAPSMARFYACLAQGGTLDGVTILRPETIARARTELARFHDPYIGQDMVIGQMFQLQSARMTMGPAPDAFGHGGAGGSAHGAWPGLNLGFSYVMRDMRDDPEHRRTRPLLAALHAAASRLS